MLTLICPLQNVNKIRTVLKLRISENQTLAGDVSKVDDLQTKTSFSPDRVSASECWCVHIFEIIDNNWQFINQSAKQFH